MAEQNMNGVAPYPDGRPPEEKMYQQFNGVHSAYSSRSSSPLRPGQVPSSQLPPNRIIPQSQLPPARIPLTNLTQQIGGLSIGSTTPSVSPKFSTSTPNMQVTPQHADFASNFPLTPISNVQTQSNSNLIGKNIVSSAVPNFKAVPPQTSKNATSIFRDNTNPQPLSSGQTVSTNNYNSGPMNQNQPVRSVPPSNYQFSNANQQRTINQNTMPAPAINHLNQSPVSSIQRPVQPQLVSNLSAQGSTYQTSQYNQNQRLAGPLGANNPTKNVPTQSVNANNFNTNTVLPVNTPSILSGPPVQQPWLQPGVNSLPPISGPPVLPPISNQKPISNLSSRYPTPVNSAPPQLPVQQQYQQAPQKSYNFQHQPVQQQPAQQNSYPQSYPQDQYAGVTNQGFNKMWGHEHLDLLQTANILPTTKIEAPRVHLGQELLDQANCSPDIFRCTMTKIPENNSLLQKSRLPLGVLIHPFRDLRHLPVIQCNVIVRCRACRTYINPFVLFVDNKRWKCNLCYRINELPEEFQYDPVTKTYGDPTRRPEIRSSTLEYIAPAEYMLRPPQPAVYLYLLDVSRLAVESGYLDVVSSILLEELRNIPGDARTQIGFIAYNSALHFYSLPEGISQPHEMTVLDIDDVFLPTPDNLLVNLKDRLDLISDLLTQLPTRYANTFDTNSALGAALQAAFKMLGPTGGRVTVFQASLPNIGPGALTVREDPSQRASAEVAHLNPANDFYKRLALECSGQQIAVDLFIVNSQYVDIATISGISRFSGGCIHHFPLLKPTKAILWNNFARCFRRYLTRKIGFEAVMRIRCTRGLSIHTFHGNFFVRSTDLLSLPNINPDAGFGMQVAIEESLSDVQSVCFQAALLYTSSKGERRIRVHTVCIPIASTLHDIIHSADQQCIIGLLSKMAVDRSVQSSLSDAREAFINVAIDILSSYKVSLNLGSSSSGLLAPNCLRLLPLYISALLKHPAFRIGNSTRLDDRVLAMCDMKTKPLYMLIQQVYPDLYPVHDLENQQVILNSEEEPVAMPPRIQLTARCLENKGAFLLDMGEQMVLLVCPNVSAEFLNEALGVASFNAISDEMYEIPVLDNLRNQRLHQFINYLNEDKPYVATVQVIRDNSTHRVVFFERLIEDRVENALSYHEFLQHLKTQVK